MKQVRTKLIPILILGLLFPFSLFATGKCSARDKVGSCKCAKAKSCCCQTKAVAKQCCKSNAECSKTCSCKPATEQKSVAPKSVNKPTSSIAIARLSPDLLRIDIASIHLNSKSDRIPLSHHRRQSMLGVWQN